MCKGWKARSAEGQKAGRLTRLTWLTVPVGNEYSSEDPILSIILPVIIRTGLAIERILSSYDIRLF